MLGATGFPVIKALNDILNRTNYEHQAALRQTDAVHRVGEAAARSVDERNGHDLCVMAARLQGRGKLAHQDLGTAMDEGHLRFEDQNVERCHSGCEPEVDD